MSAVGQSYRWRGRAQGFTLLELMVALTVGGIAITSIYAVGSASTRQFHTQQQIANAQTSLRMAVNQIKRDVSRAGYMFTPGANLAGESCAPPPAVLHSPGAHRLAAFARWQSNVTLNTSNNNTNVDPTGTNAAIGAAVDDVTLMGNYETSNEYPGVTLLNPALANSISFRLNSYAVGEDFINWYQPSTGDQFDVPAFNRAFVPGRLIRIRTTTGTSHFARITATVPGNTQTPSDSTITFANEPVPPACTNSVNNGWVAPISAIRYFVQNAPADTIDAQRNQGHGPIAQLWRQEVLPTDKVTPLPDADADPTTGDPGAPRRIADYVVGFNLAFTVNTQPGPNLPDVYTVGATTDNTTGVDPATAPRDNPERIRAVSIDLAVRTPEQDSALPWSTGALGCGNLRCFQVFSDRPGVARVRRMRAEVFVPNVAAGGF